MTELWALPGTMCDSRLWLALAEHLPNQKLRHLDLPQGDSIASIVDALCSRLPEKPVDLLGFSLGGYLATAVAVRQPQKVRRLIVVANHPLALPEQERQHRAQTLRALKNFRYRGMGRARARAMLHPRHHEEQAFLTLIEAMDRDGGHEQLLWQLAATRDRQDLREPLIASRIPTLFIHGDADALVDKEMLKKMATENLRIQHQVLERAGHMCPIEVPVELARSINPFLLTSP